MSVWPEWYFGQRHFGQRDSLASVTFACDTLAGNILVSDTLASFLASFGGPKGEKKFQRGDPREKFEKNSHHLKKKVFFLKLFPMVYPYGIFNFLTNWPKCLWPKCPAKVTLAKLSFRPLLSGQMVTLPKCHFLANMSRPKCLWPKGHSDQSVIQPIKEWKRK